MPNLHILFRETRKELVEVSDITKRFAEGAKRVITAALLCAKELGHTYVGSEHLLLGILREGNSSCSKMLIARDITYDSVKSKIVGLVGMGCKTLLTGDDMTPVCRRIILRSSYLAHNGELSSVGIEHILMAMLSEDCVATRILTEFNCDIDELLATLEELYGDAEPIVCVVDERKRKNLPKPTPLLDANGTDLTEKAKAGRIDPVIGREKEEERVISILLRRSKNNPCLVGEAGVGKTAVVESLALRIASGNVPEELKNKRIISLELSMVVAGTKYRGEFEEKIKNILEEVRNSGDVILFIDELHTVVGAGGAEGAIDASNILKPALARGEIRLIGATTLNEFRGSIEKDKALERRFQSVNVKEPTEQECVDMLYGLKEKYENYHNVTITDSAISSAVALSKRYISDRFLPDKAIDIMDEASAMAKLKRNGRKKPIIDSAHIESAVERRTGIPVAVAEREEINRLKGLENILKESIVGQENAVTALCNAVRRVRSGVRSGGRPNGSFMFIGPSGVGKTLCAKALAKAVFYSENACVRLDMSEFSEPHSVSKIIGAPPGYVGYGEGGALTEKIRKSPYSLILFDEIEKAHPQVRALLLQLLDDGRLTDSCGNSVNFENTIIIMTANCPSVSGIGFGNGAESGIKSASQILPNELVCRVDEVISFKALSREELLSVAEMTLKDFCRKMHDRGINVNFAPDFVVNVMEGNHGLNARTLSRCALRLAEEALSSVLLSEGRENGAEITLFAKNGQGYGKIKQNTY